MGFVANFIRFPAVQNFSNRLRSDKVTESLKVGTFWDTVYNDNDDGDDGILITAHKESCGDSRV